MIVTEIVKGIETRDANETATGTVKRTRTETGIATDGTLACHSLVSIPSVIADNSSCFSSQFEAGAGAVAITGNLRAASDAVTCASLTLSLSDLILPHGLFSSFSVDGAHHALVLVHRLAHGVALLRPAAVVRAVRDPVAALRVAVHATVIASRQKHCHALSVGR
jgi:hypothetical protein